MSQPLSYESENKVFLITSRTIGAKLWFVNNPELERAILSYLAKYQELYKAVIYAFVPMGNHYHLIAKFPKMNRAQFMRAFNAIVAKLVARYVPHFDQGKLWARRYSFQELPRDVDILHWFLYVVLNPVSSGLVRHPNSYRSYNSFFDSIYKRIRKFKVFDRMSYNDQARYNSNIRKEDFVREYSLRYEKVPGLEDLSQKQYVAHMLERWEGRRKEMIEQRLNNGQGFASSKNVCKIRPGSTPFKTKSSTRYSIRPLVLTLCKRTREIFLNHYFTLLNEFKNASIRFRNGDYRTEFPIGTYRPSTVAIA